MEKTMGTKAAKVPEDTPMELIPEMPVLGELVDSQDLAFIQELKENGCQVLPFLDDDRGLMLVDEDPEVPSDYYLSFGIHEQAADTSAYSYLQNQGIPCTRLNQDDLYAGDPASWVLTLAGFKSVHNEKVKSLEEWGSFPTQEALDNNRSRKDREAAIEEFLREILRGLYVDGKAPRVAQYYGQWRFVHHRLFKSLMDKSLWESITVRKWTVYQWGNGSTKYGTFEYVPDPEKVGRVLTAAWKLIMSRRWAWQKDHGERVEIVDSILSKGLKYQRVKYHPRNPYLSEAFLEKIRDLFRAALEYFQVSEGQWPKIPDYSEQKEYNLEQKLQDLLALQEKALKGIKYYRDQWWKIPKEDKEGKRAAWERQKDGWRFLKELDGRIERAFLAASRAWEPYTEHLAVE